MVQCEVVVFDPVDPQGVFSSLGKRRRFLGSTMIFRVMYSEPDVALSQKFTRAPAHSLKRLKTPQRGSCEPFEHTA